MNGLPRLLLVEDDPISAEFLQHVLRALPAQVERVASAAAAVAVVARERFDLWLIDGNLPDGLGLELLARLRETHATPAIAITADHQPQTREAMLDAGFLEVVAKPLTAAELRRAVRRRLPDRDIGDWDQTRALAVAGGKSDIAERLRKLFLDDLEKNRAAIEAACERCDLALAGRLLHRIKAGCGFVGAARLLEATRALADAPTDARLREHFNAACRALSRPDSGRQASCIDPPRHDCGSHRKGPRGRAG